MAYRRGPRIHETTTTTGTGTLDLAGAAAGKQTFVAGIATGNTCRYYVTDGTDWERFIGQVTDASPDTLSKGTFLGSSTGSAINWGAGTKDVFVAPDDSDRLPRGWIDGLGLSVGTDTDHDTDIAAGECRDDTNIEDIVLESTLVKQIDASWAVGSAAGGLDGTESSAGTPDADTWYHVWLIKRPDTGVVDALYSESATAPTMPSNYSLQRRIGAVLTDGSANIVAYVQSGDRFLWSEPKQDVSANNPGTSAVLRAMSVPLGVKVIAIVTGSIVDADYDSATYALFTDPAQADTVPSITDHTFFLLSDTADVAQAVASEVQVGTNTSSQIRTRLSASDTDRTLRTSLTGWIDPRGRNA